MKFSSILCLALSTAPALGRKTPTFGKSKSSSSDSSTSGGSNSNGVGGSAAFPLIKVDGVSVEPDLKKTPETPNARITKLRYGPYTVKGGEMQNYGMPLNKLATPCQDCWITAFQAGLEYDDGKRANVDSGMWLHHMVLHNNVHKDVNCLLQTQRIFASGNERVTRRLNTHGKWGYYLGDNDVFADVHELMNESKETRTVWITVKYEWLPAAQAEGYQKVTPIWLDVTGGCGKGDVRAKTGSYSLEWNWRSTVSGPFLEAVGHMHDGGVDTRIYVNGRNVCTSKQIYGAKPEYVEPASMGDMAGFKHISHCGVCQDFVRLSRGDKVRITANYNDAVHAQMKEPGSNDLMPVMGIVMGYVGS